MRAVHTALGIVVFFALLADTTYWRRSNLGVSSPKASWIRAPLLSARRSNTQEDEEKAWDDKQEDALRVRLTMITDQPEPETSGLPPSPATSPANGPGPLRLPGSAAAAEGWEALRDSVAQDSPKLRTRLQSERLSLLQSTCTLE